MALPIKHEHWFGNTPTHENTQISLAWVNWLSWPVHGAETMKALILKKALRDTLRYTSRSNTWTRKDTQLLRHAHTGTLSHAVKVEKKHSCEIKCELSNLPCWTSELLVLHPWFSIGHSLSGAWGCLALFKTIYLYIWFCQNICDQK